MDGVAELIRVHEEGGWPEANLVQAADSLSFLETMVSLVVGWTQSGRAPRERAAAKLQSSLDRIDPGLSSARGLAAPMLGAGARHPGRRRGAGGILAPAARRERGARARRRRPSSAGSCDRAAPRPTPPPPRPSKSWPAPG